MTPQHLKALQDSVGQARCLPARFAWDRKVTAHMQIFGLLADVIADRPGPAMLLNAAVGAIHDLMVTVGPAADGIVLSSRRRLLEAIRPATPTGRRPRWSRTCAGCTSCGVCPAARNRAASPSSLD